MSTPTKFGTYAGGLRAIDELNKTLTYPIDMPPAGALDVGSYVLQVSRIAPAISFVDIDYTGLSTPGTFNERVYYESGAGYIDALSAASKIDVSGESDLPRLRLATVRAVIDWTDGYRVSYNPGGFCVHVGKKCIVSNRRTLAEAERCAVALGYDKSFLTITEFDSIIP